jgi:hypothetical protein
LNSCARLSPRLQWLPQVVAPSAMAAPGVASVQGDWNRPWNRCDAWRIYYICSRRSHSSAWIPPGGAWAPPGCARRLRVRRRRPSFTRPRRRPGPGVSAGVPSAPRRRVPVVGCRHLRARVRVRARCMLHIRCVRTQYDVRCHAGVSSGASAARRRASFHACATARGRRQLPSFMGQSIRSGKRWVGGWVGRWVHVHVQM